LRVEIVLKIFAAVEPLSAQLIVDVARLNGVSHEVNAAVEVGRCFHRS